MGVQRLFALALLAGGLYLLGRDASVIVQGVASGPETLDALWRRLDPSSLSALQGLVLQYLPGAAWSGTIVPLLRLPAWTIPLVLGGALLGLEVLAQRRGRTS